MGEVIVITSGKGGVGKTTTTANLGAALALADKKVVLVDTDIGLRNLDVVMGLENRIVYDLVDVAEGKCKLRQALIKDKRFTDLYLLPAAQTRDKSAVTEEQMIEITNKLREEFDYILIDCSPSLNLVTINVLTASDSVIIPVEASYLSMTGLQQLLASIGSTKRKLNRKLEVEGIVINKVNTRTNHEKDIIGKLREAYGGQIKIFDVMIPESVRAKECTAFGVSIYKHDGKGKVAKSFEELTREVMEHGC